tara:strand:+ start:485 stop:751 length:267 start_codon:yes stop_codon:yes gene_type:complete
MSNIKGRLKGELTEDELKEVQAQQEKVNSILVEIGYIESRKHALLHDLADTNEVVNNTKKVLNDKYGSINVNMTTGEWTKEEEKDVDN